MAEAEAGARALLPVVESALGQDSLEAAHVLDIIVEAVYRGGRGKEPGNLDLARRAVAIRRKALGDTDPETATSLHNLGNLLYSIRDDSGAEAAYQEALRIRQTALGPDHIDVSKTLNNLGNIALRRNDYDRARDLYERSLAIRQSRLGPDDPQVARSLSNIAVVNTAEGDYAAAIALLEKTVEIQENKLGPDDPGLAGSLYSLGDIRMMAGDLAGAGAGFERAIAILEKARGPDHPDLIEPLIGITKLRNMAGDFAGAKPFHERALAIWNREPQTDEAQTAWRLTRLANILFMTGDLAGARPLYERALALCERIMGAQTAEAALTLNNLAALILETGDAAKAKPMFERALAIREAALPPGSPDIAESLNDLGTTLRVLGDDASARTLIERALAMRQKAYGPQHPRTAESQVQLALLLADMGSTHEALDAAIRAEEMGRTHLALVLRALPERQALRYSLVRISGEDLALSLVAKSDDAASAARVWDPVIRSRALVLDEMAARRQAESDPDLRTAGLRQEVAAARQRVANLTVQLMGDMQGDSYPAVLAKAREQLERAERALAQDSSRFRNSMARDHIGLAEVASRLDSDSALLAYVVYTHHESPAPGRPAEGSAPLDASPLFPAAAGERAGRERRYLAFVLRGGDAEPRIVPLGGANELESLIARWNASTLKVVSVPREAAPSVEHESRQIGNVLRSRVWEPVARHFSGVRRVFVVPDGALHLVNLGALPVGETSYLIEAGPLLHYLSAERDLVQMRDGGPGGSGLLAVGGPSFDHAGAVDLAGARLREGEPQPACGSYDTMRFEPLPASALEAAEIAHIWRRTKAHRAPALGAKDVLLLTGESASEEQFKKMAAGKRIIHLATHGFVLGESCPSSVQGLRGVGALVLPRVDDYAGPLPGSNPLSLSGLVFAGANLRKSAGLETDEGILTAGEIATLDLTGAEWVVLSACSTGVGEVQAGEGVLGLRRAFQESGARTLIMSLWPVGDEPTRAWMHSLYENRWSRGLSTAEAVREASLEVLRSRRKKGLSDHPFYWGGFVATGDWR